MDSKLAKLKKIWDKKLAKSGFEDAEAENGTLKRHHGYDFRRKRRTAMQMAHQATYYHRAQDMLNWYTFDTSTEKKLWAMHAEGATCREIATALKTNRDKVNKTIMRIRKLIAND